MIGVENKIVFITGGANGIGAAVVKDFLQRGAKYVAFLDIDKKSGFGLENELVEYYGRNKVKFIECDVTNDEQLNGAYASVIEANGQIDVVINNAGIGQETTDTIKKLIDINFKSVVTSTLKGLELMRTDHGGKGGTIINISSIAALCQMSPTFFVYFGSKSAILQFSNCIGLQNYYERTGVRVITVCFGRTDTAILRNMKSFDPIVVQEMDKFFKTLPMQTVESASRGVMEVFQMGGSGDTWLVKSNKPAVNITDKVKKAYDILSEDILT